MIKWKLMFATLPFVAAVLLARMLLDRIFGFSGVVEFSEVGPVLTGGVFLIGFMLTGTMSDYKESERLPAELASTLEAIEEIFCLAAVGRPSLDATALQHQVLAAAEVIQAWLWRRMGPTDMLQKIAELNRPIHDLEIAGASVLAGRAVGELGGLRKILLRIDVISRTSFLVSGYALLETVVVCVIGLLFLSRFKSAISEYTLMTFVTLIFVYMLRLIKDVDDPFEYSTDGARGAAEVDLYPLQEYRERAARRLNLDSSSQWVFSRHNHHK